MYINEISKLSWACRRGMLELDVLLGNFLKEAYPKLPDLDKQAFVRLLDEPDPLLFAWLMGSSLPSDGSHRSIIASIRQHAHSRIYT